MEVMQNLIMLSTLCILWIIEDPWAWFILMTSIIEGKNHIKGMIDPSYDLIISDIKMMEMEISIVICVPKITHA